MTTPARSLGKIDKAIFSPEDVGDKTLDLVVKGILEPGVGLSTGIYGLDGKKRLLPMRSGELITILGYTSNGKSSLANRIMRNNAAGIIDAGLADQKAVITVTWEQSIEEQGLYDAAQMANVSVEDLLTNQLSQVEVTKFKDACMRRKKVPWWLIGHSSQDKERPRLGIQEAWTAIRVIRDRFNVTPALIVLDYLQRVNRKGLRGEMREQYIQIVDDAKDMSLEFCPVILLSQTGRQVHDRKPYAIPELDDGQETSNLEQSSDKMLGVWMPKNNMIDGQMIDMRPLGGMTVSENLLFIRIIKQKFGRAPMTMPFIMQVGINKIVPIEWIPSDEVEEMLANSTKKAQRRRNGR